MNVNWLEIEDRRFAHSVEAIRRFASEHPEVVCSFLAYDVDPPVFMLNFDTPTNALYRVRLGCCHILRGNGT